MILIFICTIKFKNCINNLNDVRDYEGDYKKEQQLMEKILKENNKEDLLQLNPQDLKRSILRN